MAPSFIIYSTIFTRPLSSYFYISTGFFFFHRKIISLQYLVKCVHTGEYRNIAAIAFFACSIWSEKQTDVVESSETKITKIINHKWNHRLSLVVRIERGRTLQLEQRCRHYIRKSLTRGTENLSLSIPLRSSFPSILLDHVGKFDYKLSFLILLTWFERMLIFPS